MSKLNKLLSGVLTAVMALGLTGVNVHAEDNDSDDDYFIVDITYPDEKSAIRYDSRDYSYSSPVNITNRDDDEGNAKIKLIKVYKDGKKVSNKNYYLSYDYIDSSKHVETFKTSSTTLKLPIRFIKASSYTKKNPVSRLTIREKNDVPTDEADDSYVLSFKDTKYNKSISNTISLTYMKNGRYGSAKKGITLSANDILVNGKSIKKLNLSYSWWINEFSYVNKKWRADSYILSLNYPFKYDEDQNYSAYQFTIKRNKKGYIQSLKLANILTYNGSSNYGEVWEKGSTSDIDDTSKKYAKNWKIGNTFKYKYILSDVTLRYVKATSKGLVVRWNSNSDNDGYSLEYSTKKNFSNKIIFTINGHKKNEATLGNVNSKTKYYVRIRSFGVIDEKTYYSKYTRVLSATTY